MHRRLKMNTIQLKDYMQRVYLLEKSLYQQSTLASKLHKELSKLENYCDESIKSLYSAEKFTTSNLKNAILCIIFTTLASVFIFGLASLGMSTNEESWNLICKGILIGFLIGATYFIDSSMPISIISFAIYGTIFFAIIALPITVLNELGDGMWWSITKKGAIAGAMVGIIISLVGKKNRRIKKQKDNELISAENKKIQLRNARNKEYVIQQSKLIHQELTILDKAIKETKQVLQNYYNKQVIYNKYQHDFVAICSFYEYLSSGRCSQLEGHEGAYNIFEMESRQDLILRKLDDIISRLDSIEQNQYMLYTAIQNGNRETNMMLNELNRTANSIETNSAITAYNSRITAQNTEFLKWIKFLE